MPRTPIAAAAMLALTATQAGAQMGYNELACYGRAYTPEHLAAHPGQRVAEIQVLLDGGIDTDPPQGDATATVGATVRATIRDRFGEFFANFAICHWDAAGGHYECGIECDGGRFRIEAADDSTLMLRNPYGGFVLYGGCGDDAEEGREVFIDADAEHAAFRLYPLPAAACPQQLWQLYYGESY
ncbi:MAG: hypothetical protein R3F55_02430 [Alphaproteobacteria bacterium]